MKVSPSYLLPPMPEALGELAELALDIRWSWSHSADALWKRIDPDLWRLTHNPWLILQTVAETKLEALARDAAFLAELREQRQFLRETLESPCWYADACPAVPLKTAAYFCMEFGLTEALPLYSGGLGMLAGDFLKTSSDLGVPVAGVGLLYQQGYFRQVITAQGHQVEFYPHSDPSQLPVLPVRDARGEWLRVEIPLPGRQLRLRAWVAKVGRSNLYLLDSNDATNGPADRGITSDLYGGSPDIRLQQEMVLGIGGWRLLEAVGVEAEICHLNEGHAAFAVLERARSFMVRHRQPFDVALTATRAGNVFTSHTPVEAAFDRFDPGLVTRYMARYAEELGLDPAEILALGRRNRDDAREPFNMTYLAMRGSLSVNGVSRLHGEVSRRIFQPLFPRWPRKEVPITHITNGVHVPSWDSEAADALWTRSCGKKRWLGSLANVEEGLKKVPDEEIWAAHSFGRQRLVHYARERLARQMAEAGAPETEIAEIRDFLDPNALTLGFARRFTAYKRPNLLLLDQERLMRILTNVQRPVQLIIAGKAHPRDSAGKALVHAWTRFMARPEIRPRAVFLADYDMLLAEQLVQGVDLWINTPRRPWEASGTSGMKILVNGGLNLSELDGWWAEAYRQEIGWAIGDGREHGADPGWDAVEAGRLYELLEEEIVPCFHDRDSQGIPRAWVQRMRASMAELTPKFSSNRMVREYVERLYLPAAQSYEERSAASGRLAGRICRWQEDVARHWGSIHFGDLWIENLEQNRCRFQVSVYLDDLDPDLVLVELYAEPIEGDVPDRHSMERGEALAGSINAYLYEVILHIQRPAGDYTPRIVPAFEGARVPLEANQILWYR